MSMMFSCAYEAELSEKYRQLAIWHAKLSRFQSAYKMV